MDCFYSLISLVALFLRFQWFYSSGKPSLIDLLFFRLASFFFSYALCIVSSKPEWFPLSFGIRLLKMVKKYYSCIVMTIDID